MALTRLSGPIVRGMPPTGRETGVSGIARRDDRDRREEAAVSPAVTGTAAGAAQDRTGAPGAPQPRIAPGEAGGAATAAVPTASRRDETTGAVPPQDGALGAIPQHNEGEGAGGGEEVETTPVAQPATGSGAGNRFPPPASPAEAPAATPGRSGPALSPGNSGPASGPQTDGQRPVHGTSLMSETVAMFAGPPGVGKSLYMAALAVSTATGVALAGERPAAPGRSPPG